MKDKTVGWPRHSRLSVGLVEILAAAAVVVVLSASLAAAAVEAVIRVAASPHCWRRW